MPPNIIYCVFHSVKKISVTISSQVWGQLRGPVSPSSPVLKLRHIVHMSCVCLKPHEDVDRK